MKRVDQSILDKKVGDCTRACVASLLDLPLDAVPHFMRFGEDVWFKVLNNFLWALDYEFLGTGYPIGPDGLKGHVLAESSNVKGYVIASVPSKTFEGVGHNVIMNLEGVIEHDPNPNKRWQDINVLESGDLMDWCLIGPKENETNSIGESE